MSRKRILYIGILIPGLLLLLGVTVYLILRWDTLPSAVPTNFDGAGHPTGYGGKGGLLSALITGWVSWLLLGALALFPALRKQNGGPFRVSALRFGNKTYLPFTGLNSALMADELAALFGYITVQSARSRDLGAWFLPVFLGLTALLLFVPGLFWKEN